MVILGANGGIILRTGPRIAITVPAIKITEMVGGIAGAHPDLLV
jgi:hypothetical protein